MCEGLVKGCAEYHVTVPFYSCFLTSQQAASVGGGGGVSPLHGPSLLSRREAASVVPSSVVAARAAYCLAGRRGADLEKALAAAATATPRPVESPPVASSEVPSLSSSPHPSPTVAECRRGLVGVLDDERTYDDETGGDQGVLWASPTAPSGASSSSSSLCRAERQEGPSSGEDEPRPCQARGPAGVSILRRGRIKYN